MKLTELLKSHSIIGIVGNRSSGKSMLTLTKLKEIKMTYPSVPVHILGAEPTLYASLQNIGINILHSEMDVLDLRIRDAVICIDEFAMLFDTASKSNQLDKLQRFFDRIEHNNIKLIISTAREGFWNKFACARITAFLVKEVEYSALVNGTWLKERVCSIISKSDYRLECPKNAYFVVSNKGEPTSAQSFAYDADLDSKKTNTDLFRDNTEKDDKKGEN